jgi:hypothetical protein
MAVARAPRGGPFVRHKLRGATLRSITNESSIDGSHGALAIANESQVRLVNGRSDSRATRIEVDAGTTRDRAERPSVPAC